MLLANFLFSFEFPVDFKLNGKNWAENCHHKHHIWLADLLRILSNSHNTDSQYIFLRAVLEFAPLLIVWMVVQLKFETTMLSSEYAEKRHWQIWPFCNNHTTSLPIITAGHALGNWISGCSLFYKRELWASKSSGAKGDVPKIYRFVHLLHPC